MAEMAKYREISADVWKIFTTYLPDGVSTDDFAEQIHELDGKYKGGPGYEFMQRLMKVYFDELRGLKG